MMVETLIEWEIGDWSGDGHGEMDTRVIAVGHPEGTNAMQKLSEAEEKIQIQYGIFLDNWFQDYEDDSIPPEDAEKLKELGIKSPCMKYDSSYGFFALCVDDYFEIWKQLIEKVDPTLTIRQIQYPVFRGRCSGYGLF